MSIKDSSIATKDYKLLDEVLEHQQMFQQTKLIYLYHFHKMDRKRGLSFVSEDKAKKDLMLSDDYYSQGLKILSNYGYIKVQDDKFTNKDGKEITTKCINLRPYLVKEDKEG